MIRRISDYQYKLPIYAGAADIPAGAFLKKGATPATDNGALIAATGSSAHANVFGRLMETLDYSEVGQTLVAGTSFVVKPVELAIRATLWEVEYSRATADMIQCTQAVSTTTITVTSLEDDIDAAFLYVDEGTGAGQTNYLTASAAGSATLKAAFGTSLSTDSYFVKILPRFHAKLALSSDGTKLVSQAAAGSWAEAMVIDNFITKNGRKDSLNPTKHAALTGLNNVRSLKLSALIAVTGAPASLA